jgi:hypothetical protein
MQALGPVLRRAACALALAVAACRPASRDAPPANRADAEEPSATPTGESLGLGDGAVWEFRGERTYYDSDRDRDVAEPLRWTTTIVDERVVDGGVSYKIRGWPGDVLDEPDRHSWLTVAGGVVYFGDRADPAAAWLRLPPKHGESICEEQSSYCWSVEAAGAGFDVVLRTLPDITIYRVEPGRGVTRFEYQHHGSTEQIVLERVR